MNFNNNIIQKYLWIVGLTILIVVSGWCGKELHWYYRKYKYRVSYELELKNNLLRTLKNDDSLSRLRKSFPLFDSTYCSKEISTWIKLEFKGNTSLNLMVIQEDSVVFDDSVEAEGEIKLVRNGELLIVVNETQLIKIPDAAVNRVVMEYEKGWVNRVSYVE